MPLATPIFEVVRRAIIATVHGITTSTPNTLVATATVIISMSVFPSDVSGIYNISSSLYNGEKTHF